MDWTATVLAATGVAPDESHPLDGDDILPELRGARAPRARTLHWRYRRGAAPVVQEAMREGALKYLALDDRELLFDVAADPGEARDLADTQPAVVARMRAAHEAWFVAMSGV